MLLFAFSSSATAAATEDSLVGEELEDDELEDVDELELDVDEVGVSLVLDAVGATVSLGSGASVVDSDVAVLGALDVAALQLVGYEAPSEPGLVTDTLFALSGRVAVTLRVPPAATPNVPGVAAAPDPEVTVKTTRAAVLLVRVMAATACPSTQETVWIMALAEPEGVAVVSLVPAPASVLCAGVDEVPVPLRPVPYGFVVD